VPPPHPPDYLTCRELGRYHDAIQAYDAALTSALNMQDASTVVQPSAVSNADRARTHDAVGQASASTASAIRADDIKVCDAKLLLLMLLAV
jgi:hypothetical protein